MAIDVTTLFSKAARNGPPTPGGKPMQHADRPIAYNFDSGLAAEETFPIDDFARIGTEVIARDGAEAFEYGNTDYNELVYGYPELRDQIAARILARDGRDLGREGILLTSGSVQAIALAIRAFVGPGDGVVVEAPSFPYALRYMEAAGGTVLGVPVDDDGMVVEDIEARLDRLETDGIRPKMVYTISTFQLPTGSCMSVERRRKLIELAERRDLVVLEDHVYGDLRFEGEPLPTLFSLDTTSRVMLADSFSKTVAPGLRLGWLAGDPATVGAAAATRQDLGVSLWISRVMSQYIAEGKLDDHIRRANEVYHRKRDKAIAAIGEYCGPWVKYTVPHGAFYLWLELDPRVDAAKVRELALAEGVLCRPGELFFGDESGKQQFRLSYSHISEEQIEQGVAVLGRAIAASVEG